MNLHPDATDLWLGIGGSFDTFTQVICEPIDNSLANIMSNCIINKNINIVINEIECDSINVIIEDAGTGIKNIEKALTIGNKENQEHVLNEHGFGLKHSLASANPTNDSWKICTRTKSDFNKGIYKIIKSPYRFDMNQETIECEKNIWPGQYNSSGTLVEVNCSRKFFDTIQTGISGKAGFVKCLDYLCEDLGYIYSGYIKEGSLTISIKSNSDNYYKNVKAVEPEWIGFYRPKKGTISLDLGGGVVKVQYIFGEMKESEYKKYYLRNQATAGAEIRINGRLMLNSVFKDIWGLEMNPTYNHFLAYINIISSDKSCLPKTRTTKNGVRIGDEKLNNLYEWIRKVIPKPPRVLSGAISERELVERLAKMKEVHIHNSTKQIEIDFLVFHKLNCPVKIDLYVFDGNEVSIYEAKRHYADIQSVYQLLMYWDGCVIDGIKPDKAILVASTFSDGVYQIIQDINQTKDATGNLYRFGMKTWKDELINYPI